ncbi:hypothetical protein GQ53DRAFT_311324 [Thozetella sp. PMI_491]|nr:hypothetical protein GQ53DRAFT_311324 [Thozetella sp. PMI_491]
MSAIRRFCGVMFCAQCSAVPGFRFRLASRRQSAPPPLSPCVGRAPFRFDDSSQPAFETHESTLSVNPPQQKRTKVAFAGRKAIGCGLRIKPPLPKVLCHLTYPAGQDTHGRRIDKVTRSHCRRSIKQHGMLHISGVRTSPAQHLRGSQETGVNGESRTAR